jgi:hypothetical protein
MILHIAINPASFKDISPEDRRPPRLPRRDIDRCALRTHHGFPIVAADASSDHLSWVRR